MRAAGGGDAGDLIVTVRAKPHPIFEREGNHILFDLPVSFSQAALGHEALAPTLQEARTIKVPAGTQSGRVFRLKGEGLSPAGGRNTGDLRVRVIIETPTKAQPASAGNSGRVSKNLLVLHASANPEISGQNEIPSGMT